MSVINHPIFLQMKPRLQKAVLDQIFKKFYVSFKCIFNDLDDEFRRDLIQACKYEFILKKDQSEMKIDRQ